MTIQFFPTSHDAAEPIGMAFETRVENGHDVLGYLTDSGFFPDGARSTFAEARLIALESNHDAHLLEIGPYPSVLKRRVASDLGHLSNAQAAEAVPLFVSEHLETVIGMHLSETNNQPRLARMSFEAAFDRIGASPHVYTAYQGKPVSIG